MKFHYRNAVPAVALHPDDPLFDFLENWQKQRMLAKLSGEPDVTISWDDENLRAMITRYEIEALRCVNLLHNYFCLDSSSLYMMFVPNTWVLSERYEDLVRIREGCPAGYYIWVTQYGMLYQTTDEV
jgi:hypothetical protein